MKKITKKVLPLRSLHPDLEEAWQKGEHVSVGGPARAHTGVVPPRLAIREIRRARITHPRDRFAVAAVFVRRGESVFFLGLQVDYDLMERRREIGDQLRAIRPRAA